MKISGSHNNNPQGFCCHAGGDLTYYFFLFVNSRSSPDALRKKLQVDLPSNIFSCSVDILVVLLDNNDDNKPKQQCSKCRSNSEKMVAIQYELAEANQKQ